MKKILQLVCWIITLNTAIAQTTLPTSWDFDGATVPNGWTLNDTDFYTSAFAHTIPSCKLNSTGDYIQIHFTDAAGPVEFYIRGSGSWDGEFEIQESDDGSAWTTMINYMSGDLNTASHTFVTTAPPLATTRYIRFYYVMKVSGSNVSIDDVTVPAAAAGNAQEINVLDGMDAVPNGGTVAASSPYPGMSTITLTIENQGLADDLTLDIASSTVTGAEFALGGSLPSSIVIAAGDTEDITVDFTPAMEGTHTGVLTLINDDANEASYIVNFYGVGGMYATEPIDQPTAFVASNLKSYRFDNQWTPGNSDGVLILREDEPPMAAPDDGVVYQVGDQIANSKVVYVGDGTSFFPRGIRANSTYSYTAYSFNGFGQYINYNLIDPAILMVTTPSANPGTYYDNLNTSSSTFVEDLQSLIKPHSQQFYSNYHLSMINKFYAEDTIATQKTIQCNYSSHNLVYTDPFSWTSTGYTREHTLPSSWMRTWPDTETVQYSDYHNLFPLRGNVNSDRGAFPFGEVVNPTVTFLEGTQGYNADGDIVYEPRDENKGDAVRAMMYMMVCYNGESGSWALKDLLSNAFRQDETILKQWHFDDPPSNIELARNDFIDSLQNNRNPFVDHPEYVCMIDFYDLTTITSPTVPPCLPSVANEEITVLAETSNVFPSPTSSFLNVEINNEWKGTIKLDILDVTGKRITSTQYDKQANLFVEKLNVLDLNEGFYLLSITLDGYTTAKKFVVRK